MKRTGPRTEPCGTPQVRGDEGELCGGIPTVETEEIQNKADCTHITFAQGFYTIESKGTKRK